MMPDYVIEEIGETPYLYVEGESEMTPEAIGAEMGRCLEHVAGYMSDHGIAAAGPPLAVYHTHDPQRLRFRAGVVVSSEALQETGHGVASDVTPAGRVLSFTHVGPYATLRDDYADMMRHVEGEGLTIAAPTWELYIDDPATVPAAELRTKVHVALA
jgi:effector-binding domain-containing protein